MRKFILLSLLLFLLVGIFLLFVMLMPTVLSFGMSGADQKIAQPARAMSDGAYTLEPARSGPPIQVEISSGHLVSLILQAASSGKQSYPLSCEARVAKQVSIMYRLNFDEDAFMAQLPHSLNPKQGFVGSVHGRFYFPSDIVGQTADGPGGYGVHVEGWVPTFQKLSGFQTRLLPSSPAGAESQIDSALRHGYPVAIWAMLHFLPDDPSNGIWIKPDANGTAANCGEAGPNCHYLAGGEHAFLIVGRTTDRYLVFDPGNGIISYFPRDTVITGITTYFATPTGSAPGAVIIPAAGDTPDLSGLPNW